MFFFSMQLNHFGLFMIHFGTHMDYSVRLSFFNFPVPIQCFLMFATGSIAVDEGNLLIIGSGDYTYLL